MKNYIKPDYEFVQLKVEERFAGSICEAAGYCTYKIKVTDPKSGQITTQTITPFTDAE